MFTIVSSKAHMAGTSQRKSWTCPGQPELKLVLGWPIGKPLKAKHMGETWHNGSEIAFVHCFVASEIPLSYRPTNEEGPSSNKEKIQSGRKLDRGFQSQ